MNWNLTGLFLGAGASREVGMSLATDLTMDLRREFAPDKLRSYNAERRLLCTGYPDSVIEDLVTVTSSRFSNLVVYVDESGDHGPVSPEFPVFILAHNSRFPRLNAIRTPVNTRFRSRLALAPDWSTVRLVGMVEGYREKLFKDGGGKLAFFELEDRTGRVSVKARGAQMETFAPALTAGEPVLLSGKVSFPKRDEDTTEDIEEGVREPTILLSDVELLAEVIKKDARSVAIRLRVEQVDRSRIEQLTHVLKAAHGPCPVVLHLTVNDGAEAIMSVGKNLRVEVGDALLAGFEKIFGEQVAELR